MERHIFKYETETEYEKVEHIKDHVALTEDDNMVHYDEIKEKDTFDANGHEYVDLGLSVNWATCNIGATKPEEYGWFFHWGGTTPYNSDRTPVAGGEAIEFGYNSNCPHWFSGSNTSSLKWSKYTTEDEDSSTGVADNKTILDPEDDAAHVNMGGDWRMPTTSEIQELINACNYKWIENYNDTGINGGLFTLKTDSSKTLFFPAAGNLYDTSWSYAGSHGFCWSSSFDNSYSVYGRLLDFYPANCQVGGKLRYYGKSVRAVLPK